MKKCKNEERMAKKKDLDKLMKKDSKEDDRRYVKKSDVSKKRKK